MFPSTVTRAGRAIACLALLATLVITFAVHADAAIHTVITNRLSARLARHSVAATTPLPTQADVDNRFKINWAWVQSPGYGADSSSFPACTSELTGSTHVVISADQWPRINFNPTNDIHSCGSDGGFVNEVISDVAVATCQAKCQDGYVNVAAGQLDGGISKFRCDYENRNYDARDGPGILSGGPTCYTIVAVGLNEGQPTAPSDAILLHVELENNVPVESSPLVIAVSCASHSLSGTSFTIPVGQSRSIGDSTLTVNDNSGGACTFAYTSGDERFIGWTKTINFVGATLTPSLTGDGATVMLGSINRLVLTASNAVSGSLTVDVRCTDSADATVGVLNPTSFVFTDSNSVQALDYTMPAQLTVASVVVTCAFTPVGGTDTRYTSFAVPDLVFTLVRPTLIVSGVAVNQVLDTKSQTTLTLTTSAVSSSTLMVTPTCSAGTVAPATFMIPVGETTATLTFTASSVVAVITCTFALGDPADVRFAGIEIAPLVFSVDVPIAITISAANPLIPGVNPVTLLFSRPLMGEVWMVFNSWSSGTAAVAMAGSTSTNYNFVLTDTDTSSPTSFWAYGSSSSDRRYAGINVTLASRPIVATLDMTMTPSIATGNAALIGGRRSTMSVTIAHAAYGSLLVTPECRNGSVVVGSFSPSWLTFADGATVASVNFIAPTSNVIGLMCSFAFKSGDYRYTGRNVSFGPLHVTMPTITLTGTVNGVEMSAGDSVFVGDIVNLMGKVDPSPNSALVLDVSNNHSASTGTVTVISGATTTSRLHFTLADMGSISWVLAYQSGDGRFNGFSSNHLTVNAVRTTLAVSGVTNGSIAIASSSMIIHLDASHAVRATELVMHASCIGGGAVATVESIRLPINATRSTVGATINLPAAAKTPTTVSCTLSYERGDDRYRYASMPTFFVVVPPIPSSTGGSTGGVSLVSSSSSSSGKNQCDDVECAAIAHGHSKLVVLVLATATAVIVSLGY